MGRKRLDHIMLVALAAASPLACARYEWVSDDQTPACRNAQRAKSGRSFTVEEGTAADSGSLHGRVLVSASRRPIPGATITLFLDPPRNATSDSLGTFGFTDVPPGTHLISTRRIGYQSRTDTLHIVPARGAELVVPLDEVMFDGPCSGFAVARVRKPWWKLW
jgi:hypothetical protein